MADVSRRAGHAGISVLSGAYGRQLGDSRSWPDNGHHPQKDRRRSRRVVGKWFNKRRKARRGLLDEPTICRDFRIEWCREPGVEPARGVTPSTVLRPFRCPLRR